MSLTFEFRGGATSLTKSLTLDSSTKVYEDFLSVLVAGIYWLIYVRDRAR